MLSSKRRREMVVVVVVSVSIFTPLLLLLGAPPIMSEVGPYHFREKSEKYGTCVVCITVSPYYYCYYHYYYYYYYHDFPLPPPSLFIQTSLTYTLPLLPSSSLPSSPPIGVTFSPDGNLVTYDKLTQYEFQGEAERLNDTVSTRWW